MSWLSQAFGHSKITNPADAAMPYLQQIPGKMTQQYKPYQQMGMEAGRPLLDQSKAMAADPVAHLNEIMSQYEASPGYQYMLDEALRAAGNTAAAGGYRGNPEDIKNAARIADMLMGQDMQQWLANVLGEEGRGMEGERGFFGTGFQATSNLSDQIAQALAQQANLAYAGQANVNQQRADQRGGFMRGLGALGGGALGFAAGGPAGALSGASTGSRFF